MIGNIRVKSGAKAARLVGAAPPRKRARKGALYEFARRCQICIYVYHFSPNLLSCKSWHRFSMQFKKHGYSGKDVAVYEGNEYDAGTSCFMLQLSQNFCCIFEYRFAVEVQYHVLQFYHVVVPYIIVRVTAHERNEYDVRISRICHSNHQGFLLYIIKELCCIIPIGYVL